MRRSLRRALSLPEVLGVLAMIGVLCISVTPHFLQAGKANRLSKLRFNLQKLRQKVDDYRARQGQPPGRLEDVMLPGERMPENPFHASTSKFRARRVKRTDADPPLAHEMTAMNMGGWLYNPETGGVWVDHSQHVIE